MGWANQLQALAYKASAAISPYRIVKFASDDLTVSQAAAATDSLIGVANSLGIAAADVTAGATVDIVCSGIAEVECGGSITRGGPVTADSSGKGVAASPSAGTNNRIIGFALRSASSGDIIPVLLSQGLVQG